MAYPVAKRNACNAVMADMLADALIATLPPGAKEAWVGAQGKPKEVEEDGKDGCRCFLQYNEHMTWSRQAFLDLIEDPLSYPSVLESLQAAIDVLRVVVPMVCDVYVWPKTAERAVQLVLQAWEIPHELSLIHI